MAIGFASGSVRWSSSRINSSPIYPPWKWEHTCMHPALFSRMLPPISNGRVTTFHNSPNGIDRRSEPPQIVAPIILGTFAPTGRGEH